MKLPVCIDVERLVIGYCLLHPSHLDTARSIVDLEDFSLDTYKTIWRRICDLYDSGRDVDRVTVYQELDRHGEAQVLGGLGALMSLDEGLPQTPHISGYIERLRESSLRRRMILEAQRLACRAADDADSTDDILSAFAQVSTDLSRSTTGSRRPISTHEMIQQGGVTALLGPRQQGGLKLPWSRLNADLSGLAPGQLVVLMAATSRGKTSLALQVATSAAVQGYTPLIWTMEMSPKSLFRRMVTQMSGIHSGKRQLTFEEREAQRSAIARLDDCPLYFDQHSRSVGSFAASLRQVRSQARVGLAVVDYLQLIRGTGNRATRAQEVSDNSRSLKLAAMDFGIPFLVLSQVDRGSVKGEGKIGLHSGKESGDIENDADVLMWIEGGELSRDQDTPVSLHVGKQREGPAGFGVPMVFRPASQTFLEVADDEQ